VGRGKEELDEGIKGYGLKEGGREWGKGNRADEERGRRSGGELWDGKCMGCGDWRKENWRGREGRGKREEGGVMRREERGETEGVRKMGKRSARKTSG